MRIESRRPWLLSHLGLTPARKFFKDLIINAGHKNIDKEEHGVLVYDNNIISKVFSFTPLSSCSFMVARHSTATSAKGLEITGNPFF